MMYSIRLIIQLKKLSIAQLKSTQCPILEGCDETNPTDALGFPKREPRIIIKTGNIRRSIYRKTTCMWQKL